MVRRVNGPLATVGGSLAVVATAGGALLNLVIAREVFHTLFHPSGRGTLTMAVFRLVWRLTGRLGARARALAGPLAMLLVIAIWIGATVVGWALIYLPALPQSFVFASTLDPQAQDGMIDALYYAWVTQATLGYGDIAPRADTFRLLAPLQATLGFALFTLVVTWILAVYPALQRQRAAASMAHTLQRSHERHGFSPAEIHPTTLSRQLERLAEMLNGVRAELTQYPSTFYYAAPARTLSLAEALPLVSSIADPEHYGYEARAAAAELTSALELFAAALGEQHLGLPDADADEVLAAYRVHHRPTGEAEPI